ncbi:MAG: hypothetical protein ABI667_04935 [Sphingomicrobium sp.]
MVTVGRNGMLTTRAVTGDDGTKRVEAIGPGNSTARVMGSGGQKEDAGGLRGGIIIPLITLTRNPNSVVDVNRSSSGDIVRLAPTTAAETAAFIVAERPKAANIRIRSISPSGSAPRSASISTWPRHGSATH